MTGDPFIEVIGLTVAALEKAGIPYVITGSVVSGIFGEPVVSQDVDFGIRMTAAQAVQLDRALPARFYRNKDRLVDITRDGGMDNLVDMDSGWKVDLSVLPRTPYYDAVLTRRMLVPFGPDGPSFYVVTPEDVILMKLLWRKDSRSEKQWANALSVARIRGSTLDWRYLLEKSLELGIADDVIELQAEARV